MILTPKKKHKTKLLSYPTLLDLSVLHPRKYAQTISEYSNSRDALLFFISNFCFGFLIRIIATVVGSKNVSFFFLGINSLLLGIPFTLLFLAILVFTFFVIAKILGGKATLKQSLVACAFCSTPLLPLLWVPIMGAIGLVISGYLLILSFKTIHDFSIAKSIATICIPFIIVLLILDLFGLIHPILQLVITL